MITSRSVTTITAVVASTLFVQCINLASPTAASQHPSIHLSFGSPALATPRYVPRYVPRQGNIPRLTQGTGSRGCAGSTPVSLTLLAPNNDDGLTTSGHPTFFWHLSNSVSMPVELTVVKPGEPTPVFVQQIEAPAAGILQVTMPEDLPELAPGGRYRWSVALICNPNRRSGDVIAQAWIERVAVTPGLAAQLEAATSELQQAEVYAQEGLWYDTLAAFAAAQAAQPDDQAILQDRLSLLEQVGLTEVAEQERQRLLSSQ